MARWQGGTRQWDLLCEAERSRAAKTADQVRLRNERGSVRPTQVVKQELQSMN